MRPAQNALVIVAAFLVAGALFPWNPRLRIACAVGVFVITLLLFVARLRAHSALGRPAGGDDIAGRVDRIRAERAARMGRRR
jgi:hypothetical protein